MTRTGETLRTVAVPSCPLCGSSGGLLHSDVPDHFFGIHGRWNLRFCPDAGCRLIWQDPMVIEVDLPLAYAAYSTHAASNAPRSATKGLSAAFLRLDRWCAKALGLSGEREQLATAYLRDVPPGRLLDVGCGNGRFAHGMQQRGWTVRGTDFDPIAVELIRREFDFPVDLGELGSIGYHASSFDAVTVRHVIEHVRRPVEFIAECWRILKPGGQLAVVTPNAASLGHKYYGPCWRGLEQPRHLHLFNPQSMNLLLSQAGVFGANVFTSAQGAAYVYHSSSVAHSRSAQSPWNKRLAAAAIWVLQIKGVLMIRYAHRPVGEDLIAVVRKA